MHSNFRALRILASSSNAKLTGLAAATTTALSHPCTRRFLVSKSTPLEKSTSVLQAQVSAAASSIKPKSNQSFVSWYEHHLQKSPVRTKAVTGGILWGIGDWVAQVVPEAAKYSQTETESTNTTGTTKFEYDYPRTLRAMTFGFVIHAPTSHVHFNLLEYLTIKSGLTGLKIPVFKAFMEQFVYWSWISNTMYHGTMGAMQGLTLDQIYKRVEDVLWDTQKAQWVFWIPVQLLNFRFVPVRHQLNVVLLTSVVWTALLSAWYPPTPAVETEVKETTAETQSS